MKRWHQFGKVDGPTIFGFGTDDQARRYLTARRAGVVANRYEMTSLDEGEEPVDNAMIVDFDTGNILPTRHCREAGGL